MDKFEEMLYKYLRPMVYKTPQQIYVSPEVFATPPSFLNALPPIPLPINAMPDFFGRDNFSPCPEWRSSVVQGQTSHEEARKSEEIRKMRQTKAAVQSRENGKFVKLPEHEQTEERTAKREKEYHQRRVCLFCERSYSTRDLLRHTTTRCKKARQYTVDERLRKHKLAPLSEDFFKEELERLLTPEPLSLPESIPLIENTTEQQIDNRLERLLQHFHSLNHPKYKWANKRNETSVSNQKSALGTLMILANVKSMERMFNLEEWDNFFETDAVKKSVQCEGKLVSSNMAYRRVLSLDSLFKMAISSKLATDEELKIAENIRLDVLTPILSLLNQERTSENGHAKSKRSDEDFSIEICCRYKRFLHTHAKTYEEKLYHIFVALNSYNGCRSSAIVKMTKKMWDERIRFQNNWVQIYNPRMKNAQHGSPYVSIDPEAAIEIDKYLSNSRPSSVEENLFCRKDGRAITASQANYYCNLLWTEFRQTGNSKYPIRFRFNNQRYAIVTASRHGPVEGQPPLEVINGLMVHGDKAAQERYLNNTARERLMGAAEFHYNLMSQKLDGGQFKPYRPIDPVRQPMDEDTEKSIQ